MDQGQSSQTGTRDETYDVIAVLYHALQGAENCQTYLGDASSDQQLRSFFEQALNAQRQLADQAKMLLHERLMREGGGMQGGSGGSAFSQFGSSESGMGGSQDMSSQGMGSTAGMGRDVGNDPESESFGQSASGQGQRHSEMSTGGGGTSTF